MNVKKICDVIDFNCDCFEGRVIFKKEIGQTKNGKQWFSFSLDDNTCDIKVTVFNKADQIYPLFNLNDWIRVEKVRIQLKSEQSKKFDKSSSLYEASITDQSIVIKIEPPSDASLKYSVQQLEQNKEQDSESKVANLILFVTGVPIINKSQDESKPWWNANVQVCDKDGTRSRLTLWSRELEKFFSIKEPDTDLTFMNGNILGIVKAVIKYDEKYGPKVQLQSTSQVFKNQEVADNFDNGQFYVDFHNSDQFKQIVQTKASLMSPDGNSQQSKRQNQKGTIDSLQLSAEAIAVLAEVTFEADVSRAVYEGCTACKKKECSCNKGRRFYYKVSFVAQDQKSFTRATLFDNHCEQFFQLKADEFSQLDPIKQQKILNQNLVCDIVLKSQPAQGEQQRDQVRVFQISKDPDFAQWLQYKCEKLVGAQEGVAMQ